MEPVEPEYASSITEGILIGVNENNYAKFSEHFDENMKNTIPEAAFEQLTTFLKAVRGEYTPESKEFWKVGTIGPATVVYYKAKFTKEEDAVVKVVFQEIEGEIYVSGLWLDSPKLRAQ